MLFYLFMAHAWIATSCFQVQSTGNILVSPVVDEHFSSSYGTFRSSPHLLCPFSSQSLKDRIGKAFG